ncbi:mechanosensitive ion channel family protein [Arcobacter sp. 15-2]|uniref:mechanosensitive ion channel family protein n=1 Tax=Arcobacter sp. 15-2 TaxID=3374109 RepID=UPI00399D2724
MIDLFGIKVDAYIVAITIFVFFQFFRAGLRKILLNIVKKTTNKFDDQLVDSVNKPVDFLFIIVGAKFAIDVLFLSDDIKYFLGQIIRTGIIVVLFWAILNVLTTLAQNIHKVTNKFGDKVSVHVANFVIKSIRFFIMILGAIAVLQEWGYNVSGFLASMGLVGMALALAAKDTAANLFGSLVIFIDKPFRVGDWIKTPQVEGTIETIGIRSTKVRTFAQALVTVPNATLANSAILNWSAMGKRRIKMNLGVTYDTPGETVEQIIKDIKTMLESRDDIDQETIHIYFSEFASSSLNIFCYYFTKSTNWGEFMRVRENTYLEIIKIVEKNGSSFAFPTQTLHIEHDNTVE